jgi:hypothetical protein
MDEPFLIKRIPPVSVEAVKLVYDSRLDMSVPEADQNQALERWNRLNLERTITGRPPLEDRPLFRPGALEHDGTDIRIRCGITSYLVNIFYSAPCSGWQAVILGAGLSVLPVCRDGRILVGRRSSVVEGNQGQFHVIGGHAHPEPDFITCTDSLHDAVIQEFGEEMHILPSDFLGIEFLGMGLNLDTSKPEFILRASLEKDSQFYRDRWIKKTKKESSREFDELTTVDRLKEMGGPAALINQCTIACRMTLSANETICLL